MEKYDDKQAIVQSISRAADVLVCISNGYNSLTEIARQCNFGKSTAHRMLQALAEKNLVTRDPVSRQYYLGYLITSLNLKPNINHAYLTICADEEINRLADFTGETVSFGLMVALRYVNLQSYPSKYDLRVIETPKKVGTIYATASGRALLSQLNNKDLKRAIECLKLEPITEFTNIDKDDLIEQIKLVRQKGYAISSNEITVGAMSIAVPVKHYTLPATLYILGPESRLKPRTSEFIEALLNSAKRISYNIEQIFKK